MEGLAKTGFNVGIKRLFTYFPLPRGGGLSQLMDRRQLHRFPDLLL
jgi:hypothetical protein